MFGKSSSLPPAPVLGDVSMQPAFAPFVGMMGLHLGCVYLAKRNGGELATKPHLAAHFVVTLLAFSALAAVGCHGWFVQDLSGVDTIAGYVGAGRLLSLMQLSFMAYECTAIVIAPEGKERAALLGPGGIMLIHHLAVVGLAYLVCTRQYMHYYAIFFFGVPELSSVALAFIDLFKAFPLLKKANAAVNEAARTGFAVAFLPVRVGMWTVAAYRFWIDSLAAIDAATAVGSTPMPVTAGTAMGICAANVVLTLMQYYWASLILKALAKKIQGKPPGKDE